MQREQAHHRDERQPALHAFRLRIASSNYSLRISGDRSAYLDPLTQ